MVFRRTSWLWLAAWLPLAGMACSSGTPATSDVEALMRPLIEEGQADRVELVEFTKVKDQSGEFGVPFYIIEYIARVEFEQDSFVEFSSARPYVRAYPLEPPRPACVAEGPLAPDGKVWGCIRVKKGDRLRIEGTFKFEKDAKGWQPVRAEWLDPNRMFLEPKK
jgi:hypothetical protein